MTDIVTIEASAAIRSVRDVKQGICEYLEEQHSHISSPEKKTALPIHLKGWLWRREGLGIFCRYRRRFCVFKAQQSTLYIFSNEDIESRILLQCLVITRVTLTNRADRIFVVQGHLADQETETSNSMAGQASILGRELLSGDKQTVYRPEKERFKAVSAKACSIWAHCFKYHMKSYALRAQKATKEGEIDETTVTETMGAKSMNEEMDLDFLFEDATKRKRCHSLPVSRLRSSIGSGWFAILGLRGRSRGKLMMMRESVDHKDDEEHELVSPQIQFDQATGTSRPMADEVTMRVAGCGNEEEKDLGELVEEQSLQSMLNLPCIASIWEDEELLSYHVDFNAIVKKEKLAVGAYGEVWRATHRSQEVVVKNLLEEAMADAKLSTASSESKVGAVCCRRRTILARFCEEIRIMSRLEHNRIVEFRGVALSPKSNLLLVMEYLPRGDLKAFLGNVRRKGDNSSGSNGGRERFQSTWTWTKHQWRLAIDIIEGLVYLHSLNPPLVHGDIKSANILLRSDLRAKLADFGLSRYLSADEDEHAELADESKDDASSSHNGSRIRGTGRWMAPELIRCQAQSSIASDVYAFGVVLSEIDTCELPFHEREKLAARSYLSRTTSAGESSSNDSNSHLMNECALVRKIVAEGWKPAFRVTCPEAIKKLAHECLLPDLSKRPTSLAVAHRLRKAALKRERPEALAAQAKAVTSLHIH